ncbi:MAG TPA: hypothetical protein VFB63_26840 [Bryobacteraceae bacterium]|nr:hypothetical protein [Bryobacteraceae bacterium]
MAADIQHEAAFIRAFIIAAKQERLAELLAKPKRRRDVLGTLYHFKDLDPRFMTVVPPGGQTASGLEALLRERGAPELCYAISTDENLDGRTVPLRDAISQIARRVGHGTLLSCVPGRLGYFEGEEPRERYILERRGGPTR